MKTDDIPSTVVMQILHWVHCMTAKSTFCKVFTDTNEVHVGGYITEQWQLWLKSPLYFGVKWPLQFNMLVEKYLVDNNIRKSNSVFTGTPPMHQDTTAQSESMTRVLNDAQGFDLDKHLNDTSY